MEKTNKWALAIPPFKTDGHQGSKSNIYLSVRLGNQ